MRSATGRAACRTEGAKLAAERAAKHPPPTGVVFRAPAAAGVWGVKRCVERTCPQMLVNRDVNAAANMGWKALQQIRQLPCHPFVRPQQVRRPHPGGGNGREADTAPTDTLGNAESGDGLPAAAGGGAVASTA